ncbi:YcnI family protein [Micromonospora tulbaghiae]|uniref:YcnI family protein n=1 Tax=Micromonospora tulbaghiae TaxID=479978 RepID=UPI0034292FE1
MRMTRQGRWAAALLTAVLAGAVGWPGAANAAGVTVTTSPAQVRQGDAIELAVLVPADRPGTRTNRIELTMPADAPIGEVYPLSVPDWAPTITTRTLDQPVPGMHAAELNQVTHAVSWLRMPGTGTGPARLPLGMGPMPATDRLTFTVVQTYADGTVVRWADPAGGAHPAPTVELLPPLPGTVTHDGGAGTNGGAHGGHGAAGGPGAAGGAQGGAVGGAAPAAGAADDGPSADLLLGGGLLAGLAGGAAIGWLLSRRRRDTMTLPHDDSPSPDDSLSPDAPAATERPETDPRSDSPEPAPADTPAPDSPRGELAPDSPDSGSSARPLGEPVPAGGARRDA